MTEAMCRGQKKKVVTLCEKALSEGLDPQTIINEGLMSGMSRLGDDFSAGKAFVPEMLMAARCMNAAMDILKPLLTSGSAKAVGRVVLGTVRGDLHDIGKNLVRIMMEGAGLEVVDLGVDVAPEDFVQTAIDKDCSIIACSSLLTTAMNEMRSVVRLADEAGIHGRVKIMVGGAPITESFCREIGADAYTDDAASAAQVAVRLLSEA
ncbi:MAG: corrinoid protein [Oscillospiraceae bacterium]|nr:corrinoid protein [Oscillospiraceae bacterium]